MKEEENFGRKVFTIAIVSKASNHLVGNVFENKEFYEYKILFSQDYYITIVSETFDISI